MGVVVDEVGPGAQKEYDQAVAAANRLLTTSLAVLFLVSAVVLFELHDRRVTTLAIQAEITQQEKRLNDIIDRVGRDVAILGTLGLEDDVEIAMGARQSIDKADPEVVQKIINDLNTRRAAEVDKLPQVRNEQSLSALRVALEVLNQIKQRLNSSQRDRSAAVAALARLRGDLEARQRQTAQSIPTPFGTFAIPPRFALTLITFGCVAAYLGFASSASRARRTRSRITAAASDEHLHTPYWLHSWDSTVRIGRVQSAALQVVWFGLTLLLIVENIRWNRVEAFWYTSIPLVNLLLWVGLIVQGCFALAWLAPAAVVARVRPLPDVLGRSLSSITRRQFLLSAGAAGVVFVAARQWWSNTQIGSVLEVPQGHLFVNSATGVAHHRTVCAGHLPAMRNRLVADSVTTGAIHQANRPAIYMALADAAPDADTVFAYLEAAIADEPTNIPLYDRLARMYGGERRYAEIRRVYESGAEAIRTQLAAVADDEGARRRLQRVLNTLEARIQRTGERSTRTR